MGKRYDAPRPDNARWSTGDLSVRQQVLSLPKTAGDYLNNRRDLVRRIQEHFKASGITVHKPVAECKDKARQRPVVEVGFHSLRHTFVSLCRESNAPLAVVEAIVGHSNPAMTRHYTHVGELAAANAVALLPAVTGDADAGTPKRRAPEDILRDVKVILKSMTTANWKAKKASLLALLSGNQSLQATNTSTQIAAE